MTEEVSVLIEAENSAWDCLGDRFAEAAAAGRAFDLTGNGRLVTEDEARHDFSALPKLAAPGSIVAPEPTTATRETRGDDPLSEVRRRASEVVSKLTRVRESLVDAIESAHPQTQHASLHCFLQGINGAVKRLSECVAKNEAALDSDDCIRSDLENLNGLVLKSNILVSRFNSLQRPNWAPPKCPNRSTQQQFKRGPKRGKAKKKNKKRKH